MVVGPAAPTAQTMFGGLYALAGTGDGGGSDAHRGAPRAPKLLKNKTAKATGVSGNAPPPLAVASNQARPAPPRKPPKKAKRASYEDGSDSDVITALRRMM